MDLPDYHDKHATANFAWLAARVADLQTAVSNSELDYPISPVMADFHHADAIDAARAALDLLITLSHAAGHTEYLTDALAARKLIDSR